MPDLTTSEAADEVGVTNSRWHYLTSKLALTPVRKLPGTRGAMLWGADTVDTVREHVADDGAA